MTATALQHPPRERRYREAERRLWDSNGAIPSEHRLRLERTAVTVRVQEVGDGPPVLFVHGANTSGVSWVSLASRLTRFRSILLDRPGTGLSDPLPHSLDVTTAPAFGETLIVDVLDALELDSAHVVATSLGGYIALRTAAAHPDRIRRMVHFSWPVGAPIAWLPGYMRVMAVPGVGRLLAALPATDRSVRTTFRRIGHGASLDDGRITRADLDCYRALLRETDTLRNEAALARVFVSPRRGLNRMLLPDEILARVRTPTLFVWGENDPFGGPATARELVKRLADARLELLPAAGHAPWLDELDRCVQAVGEFFRDDTRSGGDVVGGHRLESVRAPGPG